MVSPFYIFINRCTTKKLAYTGIDIVGEALHQELCELAGMCPTTVISNLHRSVIDLNKDMEEATFGVPVAEIAWSEFHDVIGEAVEEMSEGGLYLDLLGHSHSYNWTELGYLISGDELDNASFTFNPNITSIRHLVVTNNDEDVVRGQSSLGGMLTAEGYSSVPSPHHPGPGGERYFYGSGSYNIKRYSSLTGGNVDGIQVAVPGYYRKSDLARPRYVRALAKAVLNFLRMYYPEPVPVTDEPDSESTGRAARNRQPKQFYMMLIIALLLVV